MSEAPHIPVLLREVLEAASPVTGVWIDGTLGAGGYTRALLDAGAEHVIGIDRDPDARTAAAAWGRAYEGRLTVADGTFSGLAAIARDAGFAHVDGVVLDIGVSSMQLDQPERGFSFRADGPLDMRMSRSGESAADLVNTLPEADLADILFQYGEERASRRIARRIVEARRAAPLLGTLALSEIVAGALPRPRPGDPHPATRTFQALRIAVNGELTELARALEAAEAILAPGGRLVVVTFHSLEDRIVKRFLQAASGRGAGTSRYAPAQAADAQRFEILTRKAVLASEDELARNPRARSAKLRAAIRTVAPARPLDPRGLGLPGRDIRLMQEGAA